MSAEPGWFPDPSGTAARYRWWDGQGWTRWLSPAATDPPPAAAPAEPGPAEPAPAKPAPAEDRPGDGSAPAPSTLIGGAEPRIGVAAAVGITIGVLVLALLTVGATVQLTGRVVGSGPAVAPPPRTAPPWVQYDAATGRATVQELAVTLPRAPWTCDPPAEIYPFDSVVLCTRLIHRDYQGSEDTYAIVGVGLVSEFSTTPGDLKKTGETVFGALRRGFFSRTTTTLRNYVSGPTDLGPTDRVLALSAELDYDVDGLPSSYDHGLLVLTRLDGGDHAGYFSFRADDAPAPTRKAVQAAYASLTLG